MFHFHNTFPVLSQSAIAQAKRGGVATVQTLDNYRSICVQAMLMRHNEVCERCVEGNPLYSLIHACYRGSLLATAPLTVNIALSRIRKMWQNKVDRSFVVSEFNKGVFVRAGFPVDNLRVKPNVFDDYFAIDDLAGERGKDWLFVGRSV